MRAGNGACRLLGGRAAGRVSGSDGSDARAACGAALEACKFPREGAGLLTSLTQTQGLVVLGEDITRVEPGENVGFMDYATLM